MFEDVNMRLLGEPVIMVRPMICNTLGKAVREFVSSLLARASDNEGAKINRHGSIPYSMENYLQVNSPHVQNG